MADRPARRPADPRFSSGPTKKRPGWTLEALAEAPLGRTHRDSAPKARLAEAVRRTHELLDLPEDYRVVITPASDTGAMEAAMWSMLGARPVDVFSCDEFGGRWTVDLRDELKPEGLRAFEAPYGEAPDYSHADFSHDVVLTWNATAAGVVIPDGGFIPEARDGLVLCDATSAAWAMPLPWEKLDVVTYSWQKCLGGEAQHGVAILSPAARKRLREHRPVWPVPRILQLFEAGPDDSKMFEGSTVNTPSLMCVEDYLDALSWAEAEGGQDALIARTRKNAATLNAWVAKTDWIAPLPVDPATRSTTSVTLKFADPAITARSQAEQWEVTRRMVALLDAENAAYDVKPHPKAPAGLRIWCGPTVDAADLEALGPWLDWAYARACEDAAA